MRVLESNSVAIVDGVIGSDVFQNFLVDLDFPNKKLRLSELPARPGETGSSLTLKSAEDQADDDPYSSELAPESADAKSAGPSFPSPSASGPQDRYIAPEMQYYTHIYRFRNSLLVPTTIGNAPSKLFLVNTGSAFNYISPSAAREVTKVQGNSFWTIKGISGKVEKVYMAEKAVLAFGHIRQWNQDLTSIDTAFISDGVGTEVSGFLGFVMLRFLDIKIDYRDALVDFQYDAKRWNR